MTADTKGWDVSSAILCGAELRYMGRDLDANPFPEAPGWYVFRRAWIFGFKNAEQVVHEFNAKGDPNYERPAIQLPLR
jgi:hypothetical protein